MRALLPRKSLKRLDSGERIQGNPTLQTGSLKQNIDDPRQSKFIDAKIVAGSAADMPFFAWAEAFASSGAATA